MVVMVFVQPMQCGVLQISQRVRSGANARECNGLPKHGKQHNDEDGRSAHMRGSIATA